MSPLLNHEITHLLLTFLAAIIAGLLFLRKKDRYFYKHAFIISLGALLGEFLVDSDHLFDYVFSFGLLFRLDYFFSGRMFLVSNKVFVPFHAWELVIILGILSLIAKKKTLKYFLTAATVGLLFHLVYDLYFNHATILGYSFIYRMLHNFDEKFFSATY